MESNNDDKTELELNNDLSQIESNNDTTEPESNNDLSQLESNNDPTPMETNIDLSGPIKNEKKGKFVKCVHCKDLINKPKILEHSVKCKLYRPFVTNGTQCSLCSRSYASRSILYGHIGTKHKVAIEAAKVEG